MDGKNYHVSFWQGTDNYKDQTFDLLYTKHRKQDLIEIIEHSFHNQCFDYFDGQTTTNETSSMTEKIFNHIFKHIHDKSVEYFFIANEDNKIIGFCYIGSSKISRDKGYDKKYYTKISNGFPILESANNSTMYPVILGLAINPIYPDCATILLNSVCKAYKLQNYRQIFLCPKIKKYFKTKSCKIVNPEKFIEEQEKIIKCYEEHNFKVKKYLFGFKICKGYDQDAIVLYKVMARKL